MICPANAGKHMMWRCAAWPTFVTIGTLEGSRLTAYSLEVTPAALL
jgi:hypothetical protein